MSKYIQYTEVGTEFLNVKREFWGINFLISVKFPLVMDLEDENKINFKENTSILKYKIYEDY